MSLTFNKINVQQFWMQQCAAMWSKYVRIYGTSHHGPYIKFVSYAYDSHTDVCHSARRSGFHFLVSHQAALSISSFRVTPMGSGVATPGPIRMAFQNGQQFSWSKPVPISWSNTYFYGQNFCCQNWFFNVQTYKFSWSRNIFVTKFLGQSPVQCQNFMLNLLLFQFYAQLCSIPTAFHGQWQSRPTCTRSHKPLTTVR